MESSLYNMGFALAVNLTGSLLALAVFYMALRRYIPGDWWRFLIMVVLILNLIAVTLTYGPRNTVTTTAKGHTGYEPQATEVLPSPPVLATPESKRVGQFDSRLKDENPRNETVKE